MTEKDKCVLRKPLAPTGDSEDCKADYEKLLSEFKKLDKLNVEGIDLIPSFDEKDTVVSLEKYNERVGEYVKRRNAYNEKYAGQIETMEDVKANIESLEKEMHTVSEECDRIKNEFLEKWGNKEIPEPLTDEHIRFMNDMFKSSEPQRTWSRLFSAKCEEERKFEEIQRAADEAFEYAAKHTLADGTVLTDEQLAEREKQKSEGK